MSLSDGDKLGPYEIVGAIGAGGMGEVYRATDTRLHREVAIKTSAERFTDRFEREARVVASLSHPQHLHALRPAGFLRGAAFPGTLGDVTGDGKKFLFAIPVAQVGREEFTVVLNWQAVLKM
jgi:serine/threonine protein kinase